MTIDELRARKRELLARKKYELDLQAAGQGDNLALFMVNEELMDVNKSTVSRTLARAKRNVRREMERACAAVRLRAGTAPG